ncbi:hypothetical protein [Halosimplex amylolyticum]|uniref:hypothetical protein n=1 Tax=Halosimplex amylolyticum TaxID=3396616 RepID=UPI003F557395
MDTSAASGFSKTSVGIIVILLIGFTALYIHPEEITVAVFLSVVALYTIGAQLYHK